MKHFHAYHKYQKKEVERDKKIVILQMGAITILIGLYASLGAYFRTVLDTNAVYSHLSYIPIILAGMWWGRKALIVAGILGLVNILFNLFGMSAEDLMNDLTRTMFFMLAAFSVGILSEKLKSNRDKLQVSEEKYKFLVEKSLAGILVYRDEEILFANSKVKDILGYDPESLKGRSIFEIYDENEVGRVRNLVELRKREGFSDLHYEAKLKKSDGSTIWADVASSLEHFERSPAVFVNIYDISGRKEAEKKRKELLDLARKQEEQLVHSTRLAELGEMAAAIAHEVNQPLTGIRNFAKNAIYMIEEKEGDEGEVKENLGLISEQVDRASKIINRIRELTRKTDQQKKSVNIESIIRENIEFLKPQFDLTQVEIILEVEEGLPEVMGDKIRLEQVFLNILTNARQAMENSKERRLRIRVYMLEEPKKGIRVDIEDTGKGFEPAEAKKLFMPFYTTKKVGEGTGLGLSISLRIIEDHNGVLEATGKPGQGARFTITLPVPEEAEIEVPVNEKR